MISYVVVFFTAASIAYLATPTIRFIGIKLSMVDKKGERKVHKKIISRFGGMAIYLGFIFSMALAFLIEPGMGMPNLIKVFNMILASTLVLFLGIYDDARGANSIIKFCVQILAALIVVKSGVVISALSNPFGAPIELGLLRGPLTVLWLVGITNAINLIDGLDGLAAGIASITTMALSLIFWVSGQMIPAFFSLSLAGACLGFLPYNKYPAKIFMGDTGSLFLGFSLASLAIFTSYKSLTTIGLMFPMLGLAVPIVDTVFAFTRRVARGDNPFRADKQHIHHWLRRKHLSDKSVVNILWGVTVLVNTVAIILFYLFRL